MKALFCYIKICTSSSADSMFRNAADHPSLQADRIRSHHFAHLSRPYKLRTTGRDRSRRRSTTIAEGRSAVGPKRAASGQSGVSADRAFDDGANENRRWRYIEPNGRSAVAASIRRKRTCLIHAFADTLD